MPDIKYQILRADKAGMPALPELEFDDPQEAAQTAKKLTKEMGEKLIVKLIIDPMWKTREALRFANGTYHNMPWEPYPWWRVATSIAIHKDHFTHPSLERPGFLAYTANEEDGTKDKQTIVRPGAYLKKFFSRILDKYGYSESDMVEAFMAAYGPSDVNFATTEEDIHTLYEHGTRTCMQGKDWPGKGKNPAHIYAAGDLQIAYLGDLKNAKARTLVWPEKKIFSRVYGDIARLTRGLERLGYKWGAPIGAKVKKIKLKEVKFDPHRGALAHCFVAPYIDKKNQAGGGHLALIDKGDPDYLFICQEGELGSHHCGLADGYSGQYVPRADEHPTFTCDRCGVPGQRNLHEVYVDENPEDEESSSWCIKCCGAKHIFRCNYSNKLFSKNDVEATEVDGCPWSPYYAEMYAGECEMTGRLVYEDNLINLYMDDGKPKKVWKQWIDENGGYFRSHLTNRFFLKKNRVAMGRGFEAKHVGIPELKHHAFQCEECKLYDSVENRIEEEGKLVCKHCRPQKQEKPQVADPYTAKVDMTYAAYQMPQDEQEQRAYQEALNAQHRLIIGRRI